MSEFRERYETERELGRGGMGRVLVARHRELGTLVAVKRLTPERDSEEDAGRFRREARVVAGLRHPNIVCVFDSGTDDEGPYMVMELLEGEDLASKLQREGPLSEPETLRILGQVSDALAHAHAAGLVHRDIKPANIFLARESWSSEPVVKVLDFGIAKALRPRTEGTTITSDGALRGSPAYMSPEQVWGQADDERTDVWALAAVTYEMLLGEHPFKAQAVGDTLARICTANYAPPSRRNAALSEWDAFFGRALAVRREDRFATILELKAGTSSTRSVILAEPSKARRTLVSAIALLGAGLAAAAVFWRSQSQPEPSHGAVPAPASVNAIATPRESNSANASAASPSDVPLTPKPPVSADAIDKAPSAGSARPQRPARGSQTGASRPEPKRRDPFTGLVEGP